MRWPKRYIRLTTVKIAFVLILFGVQVDGGLSERARRPSTHGTPTSSSSSRLHIYTCTAFAVQAPNIPRDKPLLLPPGMDEAHNKAPCHEDACVELGEDHSEVASASATSSSGSLCSLASNLSDDASYSPPDHSSASSSRALQLDSEGPLYELSSLLAQLPARRGLSKYYQGKSQSFTSISDATCLQDLGKEASYNKRMKTCKSYTAGLGMNQRSKHSPRTCNKMIAKRPSRGSFACLLSKASTSNLLCSSANLAAHQNKKDVQMPMNS